MVLKLILKEPRCNLELDTRYYSFIISRLYNGLPIRLKRNNTDIFKKRLKTNLFSICYHQENMTINEEFMI